MSSVPGTRGYQASVRDFVEVSQALKFHEVCRDFLEYLPEPPARILDVGAGAGQNAAALAGSGYRVTAIEPVAAFRSAAQAAYPGIDVTWREDSLPSLNSLNGQAPFDFILLDGVWHHLQAAERAEALSRLAELLCPGGKCALSLRNGPAGMGTHVFPTSANETVRQAMSTGLTFLKLNGVETDVELTKPLYDALIDIAEHLLDREGLAALLRELLA